MCSWQQVTNSVFYSQSTATVIRGRAEDVQVPELCCLRALPILLRRRQIQWRHFQTFPLGGSVWCNQDRVATALSTSDGGSNIHTVVCFTLLQTSWAKQPLVNASSLVSRSPRSTLVALSTATWTSNCRYFRFGSVMFHRHRMCRYFLCFELRGADWMGGWVGGGGGGGSELCPVNQQGYIRARERRRKHTRYVWKNERPSSYRYHWQFSCWWPLRALTVTDIKRCWSWAGRFCNHICMTTKQHAMKVTVRLQTLPYGHWQVYWQLLK